MDDDSAKQELRGVIEQSVALRETSIELAGRRLPWFQVSDPEAVLEQAVETGDVDPFWAATWRSARGLDRFLNSLELDDSRVLELGCGCGQVGTSVALRGGFVTMTDATPLALKIAQLNSWPVRERVELHRLVWGQLQLPTPAYPLILGSDIVYDPTFFPLIEMCVKSHLAPQGKLIIAEPNRQSGQHYQQFMLDAGWQVVCHTRDLRDGLPPIRIFECGWL